MYNPSHFQETRREVLHGLIRQQPLQVRQVAMAGLLEAATGARG